MKRPDSLESTRQFLKGCCANVDGMNEFVNNLEGQVMVDACPILKALKDIEHLLSHPPADDVLLDLVVHDAGIKLDDPTIEAARTWLTWLVRQIRTEIKENLLPFQPIRAKLLREVKPADERFPHDLMLYPTDEPFPEYWNAVWVKNKNIFYDAFVKEWDGQTCPTCKLPMTKRKREKKYSHETSLSPYNTTVYYDVFAVYQCSNCKLGWTERTGSEHFTEVDYP